MNWVGLLMDANKLNSNWDTPSLSSSLITSNPVCHWKIGDKFISLTTSISLPDLSFFPLKTPWYRKFWSIFTLWYGLKQYFYIINKSGSETNLLWLFLVFDNFSFFSHDIFFFRLHRFFFSFDNLLPFLFWWFLEALQWSHHQFEINFLNSNKLCSSLI